MRRFFPVSLIALAPGDGAVPAGAEASILDRPPDGSRRRPDRHDRPDRRRPARAGPRDTRPGGSTPACPTRPATLAGQQRRPGPPAPRQPPVLEETTCFGLVGSLGVYWGNDSYFNDAQNEIALNAPIATPATYSGVDIQSRYYMATPAMLVAPDRAAELRFDQSDLRARTRRRVVARERRHERGQRRRRARSRSATPNDSLSLLSPAPAASRTSRRTRSARARAVQPRAGRRRPASVSA